LTFGDNIIKKYRHIYISVSRCGCIT